MKSDLQEKVISILEKEIPQISQIKEKIKFEPPK